jgi:hypothetical protein
MYARRKRLQAAHEEHATGNEAASVKHYKQRRRKFFSGLLVLALSACAAIATPQYSWNHNRLTGQAAQQQFIVDNGACTASAYRAVGEPPRSPNAVSGGASGSSLGSVAEGMQQAQLEQQHQAALNQRQAGLQSVYAWCMAQRGWTFRPTR